MNDTFHLETKATRPINQLRGIARAVRAANLKLTPGGGRVSVLLKPSIHQWFLDSGYVAVTAAHPFRIAGADVAIDEGLSDNFAIVLTGG